MSSGLTVALYWSVVGFAWAGRAANTNEGMGQGKTLKVMWWGLKGLGRVALLALPGRWRAPMTNKGRGRNGIK